AGTLDLDVDHRLTAAAQNCQAHGLADRSQADAIAQVGRVPDRRTVDLDNDVAGLDAGAAGRRSLLDAADDGASLRVHAEGLRDVRSQILEFDSDPPALHLSVSNQLLHDAPGHVDGHGKPDPDIAAAGADDRRIDADE